MARWQLTEPHYLNVPGTFWEQVVTDRITQRPVRKQFPVPLFLDPRIETDWTWKDPYNPMDGKIFVCHASKGEARDIIFEGDPTPGMLPVDDEAKAISAKFDWLPTERVSDGYNPDDTTHQAKILAGLTKQLAEAVTNGQQQTAPAGFEKFMESMAAMMQQQTQFMAMLLQKNQMGEFAQQAQAVGAESPIEDDEPLGEADVPTAEELEASAIEKAKSDLISAQKAQNHLNRATGRRT